ncbi:transcriptional regulator [Pseudidiomarina halophila]|uniref:transcriptional regulator n=1 Tax=Pseudidiomarina halophila TaxID=1449799 RepID=UPI00360ABCE1
MKNATKEAQNAATFLRSIANEHRLQFSAPCRGRTERWSIDQHFPLSASAFSQHLAVLRQQRSGESLEKEAQTIFYSIKDPDTLKFMQLLKTKSVLTTDSHQPASS